MEGGEYALIIRGQPEDTKRARKEINSIINEETQTSQPDMRSQTHTNTRKFNTTCKYYKMGRGDQCQFLHTDDPVDISRRTPERTTERPLNIQRTRTPERRHIRTDDTTEDNPPPPPPPPERRHHRNHRDLKQDRNHHDQRRHHRNDNPQPHDTTRSRSSSRHRTPHNMDDRDYYQRRQSSSRSPLDIHNLDRIIDLIQEVRRKKYNRNQKRPEPEMNKPEPDTQKTTKPEPE